MNRKEQEAIAALVLNAQKVFGCISRQGTLGFLAEEAFEALQDARDAGLIDDLAVAMGDGVKVIEQATSSTPTGTGGSD